MKTRIGRKKTAILSVFLVIALLSSCFTFIHGLAEEDKVNVTIYSDPGIFNEHLDEREGRFVYDNSKVYSVPKSQNVTISETLRSLDVPFGLVEFESKDETDVLFGGIYTGPNGSGELVCDSILFSGDGMIPYYTYKFEHSFSSDTTLYINWVKPTSVTLNPNGGSFVKFEHINGGSETTDLTAAQKVTLAPGIKTINENTVLSENNLSQFDNLKREDYIFKGWSKNPNATEGKQLSEIIIEDNETLYAIWDHTHVEKILPAVVATCTSEGKTEGKVCEVCGEVLKEQETIAALGHDYADGVCTICGAEDPDYVKPLPDGLNQIDGEWVYIRDNKIATDFNGLVKHDKEFWYIENGKANFEYTGLVTSSPIEGYNDIRWYWVTKGVFDKTHTGAEPYLDRGTYLVENGYIDFHKTTVFYNEKTDQWMVFIDGMFSKNANGIYQNKYGWWKATNGIVNFKENGVFQNSFGWWRVKDSKVDFNAQGIYQNNFGWWKTTNGKVTFKENGVFQNEFGWWKVKDSKVDFSFTGIASNKYGSWYIKGGKVDFNKNGKVNYNNKTYTIKNGKVV